MNSLASWIDRPLLDSIVQELTSVEELSEDFAHLLRPMTLQSINHADFQKSSGQGYAAESSHLQNLSLGLGQNSGGTEMPTLARPGAPGPTPEGVGHTQAQLKRFRECLQTVSHRFQSSGLLRPAGSTGSSGTAEPTATQASKRGISFFVPPQGTLAVRLRGFLDWLHAEVPSMIHAFIIDSQGCLASDSEPPDPILAASLVLADASRRTSRHLGKTTECAMQTEISDEERLCVLSADSPAIGSYSLAMVIPYTFPSGSTERLRTAFLRALSGE